MTAGNSLSENECFSRRKWTSTTLSSAAKNAAAMKYHGTTTGGSTGACSRRKTTNRRTARPTSRALNRAIRTGAGTRRASLRPASVRPPVSGPTTRGLRRRSRAPRSASSISHSIRRRPQGGRHRLGPFYALVPTRAVTRKYRVRTGTTPPRRRPGVPPRAATLAARMPPHRTSPADMATASPRTLVEKIWDAHVVAEEPGAPAILAVDLHLVHEVTSPQAFTGLRTPRPRRPPARQDRGHRRPLDAHHPPRPADDRHAGGGADQPARGQLPRVRHPDPRVRQRHAGHRPRHRPRARAHAARA